MAVLWSPRRNAGRALGARVLIGRGPECGLRLEQSSVSANHAVLTWKKGGWWARDLGSRNGTRLDGALIEPGQSAPLRLGATLSFGGEEDWRVIDLSAPGPMGFNPRSGACVSARGGLLVLPSDEDPQLALFRDERGAWRLEREEDEAPCSGDLELELSAEPWWVLLPCGASSSAVETTLDLASATSLETISLGLQVSQDEEHVEVSVLVGGEQRPLSARVHHFLVLQLARARLADIAAGVDVEEEGWVYAEDLCAQLKLSPRVMSVQLLRARQQLAEVGVEGVGRLFERRRLSGQLRLGVRRIELEP